MDGTGSAAAAMIWQAWLEGRTIPDLPVGLKPRTRAAAYAAQAYLEAQSSRPRAGWKIAATSSAGQGHINVDGPLAGRLLAETMLEDGAEVSLANNRMRVVEPEFAFRFARPVPARGRDYEVAEVMDLVGEMHLALELPDSRFSGFTVVGGPALIVDNACSRELVVGPVVGADWRALDLSAHRVQCAVGDRYTREGVGANVLGDPRLALTWCVNEVSALGIDIAAGELITTGTCAPPLEIEDGDRVTCDFGALGTISVSLTD